MVNFKGTYKDKQPWVVQVGMILGSESELSVSEAKLLIDPNGREISEEAYNVHKISEEKAASFGVSEETVCYVLLEHFVMCKTLVCHNVEFDRLLAANLLHRNGFDEEAVWLMDMPCYCTMRNGTHITKIPKKRGGYKWPKLNELYFSLFGEKLFGAHDAMVDIKATQRCYYEMVRIEEKERSLNGA